jgi:hypothetical protein
LVPQPSDAVRVVNAVLTQIDALRQLDNVLILTTSNITQAIDIAFVDRADIKQYIGLPSHAARYDILRTCMMELMRVGIIAPSVRPHARVFLCRGCACRRSQRCGAQVALPTFDTVHRAMCATASVPPPTPSSVATGAAATYGGGVRASPAVEEFVDETAAVLYNAAAAAEVRTLLWHDARTCRPSASCACACAGPQRTRPAQAALPGARVLRAGTWASSLRAVLCCAVLCCAVLCCAVLCCAVLCCAVLCCAVLCCAACGDSAVLSRPVQIHQCTPVSFANAIGLAVNREQASRDALDCS